METKSSWNKIVAQYNKNRNSKEEIVQASWELLFSTIFNYTDSNIVPQLPVKMGVETKRADILIKNGNEDLFVVELKRHTLHDGQAQLFSYLNQLKINIGVLVCDKLYIYDFDYTTRDENYSFVEINFIPDNPDGENDVPPVDQENKTFTIDRDPGTYIIRATVDYHGTRRITETQPFFVTSRLNFN